MTIALLESFLRTPEEQRTIWIADPERIITTSDLTEVSAALQEVEGAVSSGFFAVGFVCYEAGYHFLPNMPPLSAMNLPLVWFALHRHPATEVPGWFNEEAGMVRVEDLKLDTTVEEYRNAIESVRSQIEQGYTYQVNYTMRYQGKISASPRDLYRHLRLKQPVPYAAYLETDDWAILSLSPELFFRKRGNRMQMRPMKGTSPRGRTPDEDKQFAQQLVTSEKERAENLMIVDLLRNDLGKICEPDTIHVPQPLVVERYETVLQMTSLIEGKLLSYVTLPDLFRALFPCGSVTGAPKIRTMQIIHQLEKTPRQIYTGAIGFVSQEETVFSVAIRTAVVQRGTLEMGVGSGILYEADADREYEECRVKARFLTEPAVEFDLIETMMWLPNNGLQRLSLHLDRLMSSAEFFSIPLTRENAINYLIRNEPDRKDPCRIRLLVNRAGVLKHSVTLVEDLVSSTIRWAHQRVNSNNRFLYHKTTHRPEYQQELNRANAEGYVEVLFRNEREEVTEGAFSNLWILKDGVYRTPPVSCGLLAGTYRRYLLEEPSFPSEERVLYEKDVITADEIYISNAVRGLVPVSFKKTL